MSLAILSHISLSSYYMLYRLLHFAILTGYNIPRPLPRMLPIVCPNPPRQQARAAMTTTGCLILAFLCPPCISFRLSIVLTAVWAMLGGKEDGTEGVDSRVQVHCRNVVTGHYKYVTWHALSDRSANWPKPGLVTDRSVSVSSPAERGLSLSFPY